ncbi:hypothetical protein [Heyndrickxia camelliae]|uniref:Uncharacterized protein n=1 Tax=Heyndrickxia camelliae TaxID=1707093 RepID=A0A2N3LEX7_9BACI|nr:hypothetical protein [Heyndrickxia camelliae]PKR83149.1 hypothetical protein CWO92_20900 [Heyndrickxia camelliae]
MKMYLRLKYFLRAFVILTCLLVGWTFADSKHLRAESILGSSEDKGIKLTLDNYKIQHYGQEMIVHYTIQTASGSLINDDSLALIKDLDFSIGSSVVRGKDAWHKKISNQKYQGAIKVDLPQYRPAISNVVFSTDSISNQKGMWTINFQIQK